MIINCQRLKRFGFELGDRIRQRPIKIDACAYELMGVLALYGRHYQLGSNKVKYGHRNLTNVLILGTVYMPLGKCILGWYSDHFSI